MVALGKKCELDSQCQKVDFNAVCHESRECLCMDQFVNKDGKCASIVGEYETLKLWAIWVIPIN